MGTLAAGEPARTEAQELRGFLVLEGDPGFLSNAYLDRSFGIWSPELESAFGTGGATGLLEWTGDRTTARLATAGRLIGFADSTSAWHAYLVRGDLERRLGNAVSLGFDVSFSEVRRSGEDRRTVWGQAKLRWTASPRLRLTLGPAIARRRFTAEFPTGEDDGGGVDPPIPVPGDPPIPAPGDGLSGGPGLAAEEAYATSVLGFVGLEAWPGRSWQVRVEGFGSHTEAGDLGIDYDGGGGTLRLTRWFRDGVSLGLGGGVEGFGFRAAVENADGSTAETLANDLIWHAEASAGWPLTGRVELRSRLAGVGRSSSAGSEGPDIYASAGFRVGIGATLASPARRGIRWSPAADGLRVEVPYSGPGRLFLVGDFNGWRLPGLPLRPAVGGIHAATLRLDPGSYRYRVRLVRDEEERWLELPEGTPTVPDGFGGTNGLVVVGEEELGSTERR